MKPRAQVHLELEPFLYVEHITDFKKALEELVFEFGGKQPESRGD